MAYPANIFEASVKQHVVQFVDRNVSRKDYETLGTDKVLVSKVFFVIQGEGPLSGYPAVFIRLAGCNRGSKKDCPWCDANFLYDSGKVMTTSSLISKVNMSVNEYSKDKPIVVITGGEPLLQPGLEKLVADLHEEGFIVQIETNGDLLRADSVPRAIVVCSPKVSMKSKQYKKLPAGALARADYLKFVVEDVPGSPYNNLPEYASTFADVKGSYKVFISPISVYARDIKNNEIASMWSDLYNKEIAERNHKYAAKFVMDKGFRLSLQTHLLAGVE
jgi:organic radical activating enzyme